MTKKEIETLFNLAQKLYKEEVGKSGMLTLPYVWAKNGGQMVVVSMFGRCSTQIEKLLWAYNDLIEREAD